MVTDDITPRPVLRTAAKRACPVLEALESRCVPTVTYHGGALLPHVEVQALYYGSDWSSVSADKALASRFDAYLSSLVQGSYMDMLSRAGYNVGRGSASAGVFDPVALSRSTPLTDAQIEHDLQSLITGGKVKPVDANRLYVVFVEPNVVVRDPFDGLSSKDFLGYHYAFQGSASIHYAVIPFAGGSNLIHPGLAAFDSMTIAASHEISESVTDPDADFRTLGWYDNQYSDQGEIGDIVNGEFVYLNGYAVQKAADKNDQPMTPTGAAAVRPVNFLLLQNGQLQEHTSAGTQTLLSGVAQVSGLGIDDSGHAMVDVITTGGVVYEYHDSVGWLKLDTGVQSAAAGDGVSYVLLTSGVVWEYHDTLNTWSPICSGAHAIDTGTDQYGVNDVDVVLTTGVAWEHSDSTGWHFLANSAKQVSAGRGGVSEVLLQSGNVEQYSEAANSLMQFASGIAQVAIGSDASGGVVIDVLYAYGGAWEYRGGSWSYLWNGVRWLGKAVGGTTDILFTTGELDAHTGTVWVYLSGTAAGAS